jgi:putative transposase
MKPTVNTLIQSITPDNSTVVERVLYIDSSGENVAIINASIPHADPDWHRYEDLVAALGTNESYILEIDHLSPPALSETELASDKFKKIKSRGETDWQIIKPLVSGENAIKILFPLERKALIENRSKELMEGGIIKGISPKSILRKIRRYWQRGQTRHALFPDYIKSGGRGKPRKAGERKRGAPSRISKEENRPTGVNVDALWLNTIIKGGITFYLNREKKSLGVAYRKTLATFCAKGYDKESGKPILPDPNLNEVFTERQFKYHFQQHQKRNLGQAIIKRHGERKFNLRFRDIKGDSTSQAQWPGALYQIDATLADVYLVSALNRRHIIGRPLIWVVSDVLGAF